MTPLDQIAELTGVTFSRIERYEPPREGRRLFVLHFPDGGQRIIPVWQARSASNLTWWINQFRHKADPDATLIRLSTADAKTFTRLAHEAAEQEHSNA